jgi:hypothetical protein
MAERTTQQRARTAESSSDKKFPITFQNKSKSDSFNDDFISTLSESYENRRAVQVFKWEAARQAGLALRGHNA